MAPEMDTLVICGEKYMFTPDQFKSATRSQRTHDDSCIFHQKAGPDIISDTKFSRSAVTKIEGKQFISTYIAKNVSKLTIKKTVNIIFDSEYIIKWCACPTLAVMYLSKLCCPSQMLLHRGWATRYSRNVNHAEKG